MPGHTMIQNLSILSCRSRHCPPATLRLGASTARNGRKEICSYGAQDLCGSWRIYENQWYQYSRGYFGEGLFRAYQQHLRNTLGVEDYAELWRMRKELGFFHPDFVSHVDSFTAEKLPYTLTETLVP